MVRLTVIDARGSRVIEMPGGDRAVHVPAGGMEFPLDMLDGATVRLGVADVALGVAACPFSGGEFSELAERVRSGK